MDMGNYNEIFIKKRVGVFIHLYYIDTVETYYQYIDNIPQDVDVYISTSRDDVEKKIEEYFLNDVRKKEVTIVRKKNRGRDISALLVAFRKKILNYDYFCFVHDKKEKSKKNKLYIEQWIDSLWGNLLGKGDAGYILKILSIFEHDSKLGLLAPPEPIGEVSLYHNCWPQEYKITYELAKKLELGVRVEKEVQSISLGTCFWARTSALKKLFVKNWRYEDFDDEPIPQGALCYGVERIFPYVAADAGYISQNVMSDIYVEKYISFLRECRISSFSFLEKQYGIMNLEKLNWYNRICNYFDAHQKVYLYGAGMIGRKMYNMLSTVNRVPDGFVITGIPKEDERLFGLPVYSLGDIRIDETVGIIISVLEKNKIEIINQLEERNIKNYIYAYDK